MALGRGLKRTKQYVKLFVFPLDLVLYLQISFKSSNSARKREIISVFQKNGGAARLNNMARAI